MSDFNIHAAEALRAKDVNRWHMVHVDRVQSVAEHTYSVAVIACYLAHKMGKSHLQKDVIALALTHDMEEVFTGDIPTPVKNAYPENFDYNTDFYGLQYADEAYEIVKMADTIEATIFISEHGRGSHAKGVADSMVNGLNTLEYTTMVQLMNHEHRTFENLIGDKDNGKDTSTERNEVQEREPEPRAQAS